MGAFGGARLVITGLTTVYEGLTGLVTEFTVTATDPGPLGVELGTSATIWKLLQLVIEVAATPLNLTVLVPWVAPKFDPAIVTEAPSGPRLGEMPLMNGVVPTVIDALSKVAVVVEVVLPLPTAKPT